MSRNTEQHLPVLGGIPKLYVTCIRFILITYEAGTAANFLLQREDPMTKKGLGTCPESRGQEREKPGVECSRSGRAS